MTSVQTLVARIYVHGRVMDALLSASTTVQTRAVSIAVRLRSTWTLVARMHVHIRAIDAGSSLTFVSHHISLSHPPERLGGRQPPSRRQPTTAEPTDRPSLTMRTHRRRRARREVRPQARNASRIKCRIRLGGRTASAKPPHWAIITGRARKVPDAWAATVPGQGQEAPRPKRVSIVKDPAWTASGVATR